MAILNENIHFSLEDAFQEVLRRRREQAAYSQEAYDQLVQDVFEEKLDRGELSDDDDIDEWIEQLQKRWNEVEQLDDEDGNIK